MSDSLSGELAPSEVATDAGSMVWHAEELWAQLEPYLPGLSVEVVARISSTNTALLDRSRTSSARALNTSSSRWGQVRRSVEGMAFGRRSVDLQPCLLVAEYQTAGRGRQGRPWQAVPGASLTFSLALTLAPPDWSGLSLAVGVALAEALDPGPWAPEALQIGLKWPNDLWLMDASGAGRKLGGILIETVHAPDKRLAVIGFGLNVLPLYPSDVKTGVACLQEIMPHATPPWALATLALPLVQALQQFEREGFEAFAERFARRDILRGKQIHTTQAGASKGLAQGIGRDGSLQLVTEDGRMHAINSGEVSVRLDPPGPDSSFGRAVS